MNQRLKQSSFLFIICTVPIVCMVGALLLPHDSYIRYQTFKKTIFDYVPWMYERIHFDETPIDIVFIGSSRMGAGINSAQVEEELEKRGHKFHVVNFSIAATGYDTRLAMLHDLLSTRKIKLLIFSVEERMPRDGHQAFGELGTVAELLSSPILLNRNLFKNLARLPYRQIELAVASLVPEAFGYHHDFDQTKYAGSCPDRRLDINETKRSPDDNSTHEEMMLKQSRTYKGNMRAPVLPGSLSFVEFGVSQHYLKEMQRLSKQHGFQTALMYQPFYDGYDQPFDAEYLSQFGPIWRSTFLMHDSENFVDAMHASPKASDQLAGWVADRILAELKVTP